MTDYLHPDVYTYQGKPFVTCNTAFREDPDIFSNTAPGCGAKNCNYLAGPKRDIAARLEAEAKKAEEPSSDKLVESLSEENPLRGVLLQLHEQHTANKTRRQEVLDKIQSLNDEFAQLETVGTNVSAELEKSKTDAQAWEDEQKLREQLRQELDKLPTLDYDQVINVLVRHGVTRLSEPQISARRVLSEAAGVIAETFWIKNSERQTAEDERWFDSAEQVAGLGLDKYKAVPIKVTDYDERGNLLPEETKYMAVTGVCSIGALALARSSMEDGKTFDAYESMASRDLPTALAGEALARAIRKSGGYQGTDYAVTTAASTVIANWNDKEERTRKDVSAMFSEAAKDPVLDFEELWILAVPGTQRFPEFCFGGEQEAKDFLDAAMTATDERSKLYRDTVAVRYDAELIKSKKVL